MKSDTEIRDEVIDELRWDPQITEPDAIGVAVTDGAVTLTGSVPTYAQKLVAARAAERVYGVKAVANELKVKLADAPRDDSDAPPASSWRHRHADARRARGRRGCRAARAGRRRS